jgi:NADPH-dependent ferric siderophore reductase
MLRVTFFDDTLRRWVGGAADQRIKIFFPRPGQLSPVYPTGEKWWLDWREMPEDIRAVYRTYTVRRQRPDLGELDVDFVLHEHGGPGSSWAAAATPGDRVGIWGPGSAYRPEAADWQLIAGDETALPAVSAIVESLVPGARATVFIEVGGPEDEHQLHSFGQVDIRWLHRGSEHAGEGSHLVDAIRGAVLPVGRPYCWVAGESSMVTSVRRHLVNERGVDREHIYFSGYWRHGQAQV